MRYDVEHREPHAHRQPPCRGAHALDRGAQPACSHLERCVAAEQLVLQVAVARLHVDEVEAGIGGDHGRGRIVVGEGIELVVGPSRADAARVEQWFDATWSRRHGPPPGVRELQPRHLLVGEQPHAAPRDRRPTTVRDRAGAGWRARRDGRRTLRRPTPVPAPLRPKRSQRRRTRSVGRPSSVPSQPSIGRMANRFSRDAPGDLDRARRARRPPDGSANGSVTDSSPSRARNASASRSRFTCGQRRVLTMGTSPRGVTARRAVRRTRASGRVRNRDGAERPAGLRRS